MTVPFISQEPLGQLASASSLDAAKSALYREAEILYNEGRYDEVCETLQDALLSHTRSSPGYSRMVPLLVRSYANLGAPDKAVAACQKAIEIDPLNARLHYLLATLLSEHARDDDAELSLKRTLYLDPDFAIAHFALASLTRRQHRLQDMQRHLRNTYHALRHHQPDDLVPEAEGLTVKRVREIITHMLISK